MFRHSLILLLSASLFLPGAAHGGPRPALTRAAFVAPLVVDGRAREDAWIAPDPDEKRFLVEGKPLLASLTGELPSDKLRLLESQMDSEGMIPLSTLRAEGLVVAFNELTLELSVNLPAEAKRMTSRSVVRRERTGAGQLHPPSPMSAYLNTRVSQPFAYPANGEPSSRRAFVANFDSALNVDGWALESGATYTEDERHPWRREDTALVRDLEEKMLRFTAGDQQTSANAYLASRSLGGIGVSRVYAIQPHETTQPVSRTELLLKRPSTVDVLVNGVLQSQLRLPAGPVNIQDFPLSNGFNNVVLRVTDDLGRTELVDMTVFLDPDALGKGVQLFSYHVGFPSTANGAGRHYETRDLNFSFFHRTGLSDVFTAGLFGQGSDSQTLGGLEGIFLGRFGSANLTLGGSRITGQGTDFAGRFRYRTLDGYRGEIYPWRFSFESEYKGWRFAPVGTTSPANPFSWAFDAYTLYRSRRGIDIGLGSRYQFRRGKEIDVWQGRTDVSFLLSRTLRGSVTYSYTRDLLREHRAFFALTWVEPSGRHYVNASYDYPSKTTRIDATRNPLRTYEDLRLSAGLQRSPELNQVNAQAEYVAPRAILRMDHQSNFPRDANRTQHVSALGLSSALVWGGSSVSLSRPVTDSFAVLSAKGLSAGEEIAVNPQDGAAETYITRIFPGVLPNLSSYYETPVSLDTSALPPGLNVAEEYLQVKPTYKSGVEVNLNTDSSVTIVGVLKKVDGTPLALASGDIVKEETKEGAAVFFTNKRGQFVAENLKPGNYHLRFYEGDFRPVRFRVHEGARGMIRLGDLEVLEGGAE